MDSPCGSGSNEGLKEKRRGVRHGGGEAEKEEEAVVRRGRRKGQLVGSGSACVRGRKPLLFSSLRSAASCLHSLQVHEKAERSFGGRSGLGSGLCERTRHVIVVQEDGAAPFPPWRATAPPLNPSPRMSHLPHPLPYSALLLPHPSAHACLLLHFPWRLPCPAHCLPACFPWLCPHSLPAHAAYCLHCPATCLPLRH